jgi:ferredoxin
MTDHNHHTAYRVTIDTAACDGIFACLVRDDRFVESEEGLATFDPEAVEVDGSEGALTAEFDDGRREDAEQAAAACPPGAITVEEVER